MNKTRRNIFSGYYYILSTYKFSIHVLQICHTAWALLPHTSGRFFPIFKIPWTVNRAFLPAVWFSLPSRLLFFYCKSHQCLLPDGFLNEELPACFLTYFKIIFFSFPFRNVRTNKLSSKEIFGISYAFTWHNAVSVLLSIDSETLYMPIQYTVRMLVLFALGCDFYVQTIHTLKTKINLNCI